MRRRHFELLQPVCPACRSERQIEPPLRLAAVMREAGEVIQQGILHCSDAACQREYPIIDGLPLLVPNLRQYVGEQLAHLLARDDLSNDLQTLIGDCCGPGSAYDLNRQHLSSYVWAHYGDLDPGEPEPDHAGNIVQLVRQLLPYCEAPANAPILDAGSSVGRSSFALAEKSDSLVLGVDLNFSMLRLASRVLHDGVVRYPRKRVGLVYDERSFAVAPPAAERVDFWVCDMLAPPFRAQSFGTIFGLNVADVVASPLLFLQQMAALLAAGGTLALTTPYDWSAAVPVDAWLGGHSQRGPGRGSSELVLRGLLIAGTYPQSLPDFRVIGEIERLPWHVRMFDRGVVEYQVHGIVARKRKGKGIRG